MGIVTLALFVAALVSFEGTGAATEREIPGFIRGGRRTFYDDRTGKMSESVYYTSIHTAEWPTAKDYCDQLENGMGFHLVSIETYDEWRHLLDVEFPRQGIYYYWTSAEHNGEVWHWHNGTPINETWAPWAPGSPTFPSVSGVGARYLGNHQGHWETLFEINAIKFICELDQEPDPTEPEECYVTNDLVVVLDSSGSIGSGNFEFGKDFVARLVAAFNVHDESREGVTTYSTNVNVTIPLNHTHTPKEVDDIIRAIHYDAGGTNTALAISNVRVQFRTHGRVNVTMNMLVLTDGNSNAQTPIEAAAARAEGIVTYSVGIGQNVNDAELLAIAGDPSRMFRTEDFDELVTLLRPVSEGICPTVKKDIRNLQ